MLLSHSMPDPVEPTPPLPSDAPPPSTTTHGLPPNIAAALACIPLIGGVVFYILEKHDQLVRFYAMQSIIFGGAWLLVEMMFKVIQFVFAAIPLLRVILVPLWMFIGALVFLAFAVVTIVAMVKAFSGVRWDIPFIGPVARKQMGEANA